MKYIKVTNDNVFIHDKSYCDVYNKDDCNQYKYFNEGLYCLDNQRLLDVVPKRTNEDDDKYQLMLDLVNNNVFTHILDLDMIENIDADVNVNINGSFYDVEYIRPFFNYITQITLSSKIHYDTNHTILKTLIIDSGWQKFKRVIAPVLTGSYTTKPFLDLTSCIKEIEK